LPCPPSAPRSLVHSAREVPDRGASGGEAVMVERNRAIVARITPPERTVTAVEALAALRPVMTLDQAAAWSRDIRQALDEAVRDPWE
jgi:hypothetical protein